MVIPKKKIFELNSLHYPIFVIKLDWKSKFF